jgi:Na+/melibiose symporter-like transporter
MQIKGRCKKALNIRLSWLSLYLTLCYALKKASAMINNTNNPFKIRDYLKITALGFALTALWQSLHTIILPQRLLDFVPETQKNTFLGLLTLAGLVLAMVIQPIAGGMSDRSRFKWGRRRPFILIGGVASLLLIPGIGFAGGFAAIFIVYCLLQVASNTAQGPYQAFIPEYVPENKHGRASGVKALLEVAGGAIFVYVSSLFIDRYSAGEGAGWLWLVLGILIFVYAAALVITLFKVHEQSTGSSQVVRLSHGLRRNLQVVLSNQALMWFLASRLLIYMAFTTIQQFALYFLSDVIGVTNPAEATARFLIFAVVGMLIVTWPAGYLSDRIGRKPISMAAGLLGALGIGIIAVSKDYNTMLWAAGIIGMAMGAFNSANWALATDLAAKGEEARYLGIANVATAGGAALARAIGPVIDYFNGRQALLGYDVMLFVCIGYFVIGALLILKVKPRV